METTIVKMKYLNIDENAPKMKILKEKFDKKEIQNLPDFEYLMNFGK